MYTVIKDQLGDNLDTWYLLLFLHTTININNINNYFIPITLHHNTLLNLRLNK